MHRRRAVDAQMSSGYQDGSLATQLSMFVEVDTEKLHNSPRLLPGLGIKNQAMSLDSKSLDLRKKLRGGYYTPKSIAGFLARWAIQEGFTNVLEPSAGDGEIVAAGIRHLNGAGRITAVEWDPEEADKVAARVGPSVDVVRGDFFAWFHDNRPDGTFDAVLGNPPFIRYHDFPEEHRKPAFQLMKEEGLNPSRLTNAWLPFVVMATRALRPEGRLALVLPAELLQVTYAAELREYLSKRYAHLTVMTFRRLVFSGIQQETILLLGVRQDRSQAQISFIELDDIRDIPADQSRTPSAVRMPLDHAREKWTQYYLSPMELGLIREMEESQAFGRLGDLASVDIGIVTGRNEFFVLSREQAERRMLLQFCLPMVGRSAQIPGLVLRKAEWELLSKGSTKCFLVQLGDLHRSALPKSALAYVEFGENLRYHEGYKCSIRTPRWWNVPSVWIPDAFLLRQIHGSPRITLNQAQATCTDTIHRVRVNAGVDAAWLAAASVNSLTLAFSEIRGRSYGGGVLELEPTEAEGLPFPAPKPYGQSLPLEELDSLVRRGEVESALSKIDKLLIREAGVSDREIETLRQIWRKLSERRICRNHRGQRR